MATSSGILQSFLRDALQANKRYDQLHFEDLLEYNRAACGLIKMDTDPNHASFEDIENLLHDNNAVILFEDQLYYVDIKNRKIIEFSIFGFLIVDFMLLLCQ